MARIQTRDFDYIEARLITPATDLLDAIERLKQIGGHAQAERLMVALQALIDTCREEQRILKDFYYAGQKGA